MGGLKLYGDIRISVYSFVFQCFINRSYNTSIASCFEEVAKKLIGIGYRIDERRVLFISK
jgi:hypothetical protein